MRDVIVTIIIINIEAGGVKVGLRFRWGVML